MMALLRGERGGAMSAIHVWSPHRREASKAHSRRHGGGHTSHIVYSSYIQQSNMHGDISTTRIASVLLTAT